LDGFVEEWQISYVSWYDGYCDNGVRYVSESFEGLGLSVLVGYGFAYVHTADSADGGYVARGHLVHDDPVGGHAHVNLLHLALLAAGYEADWSTLFYCAADNSAYGYDACLRVNFDGGNAHE